MSAEQRLEALEKRVAELEEQRALHYEYIVGTQARVNALVQGIYETRYKIQQATKNLKE